jgi:ABC-2 type transport system ATP-binding protein
VAATQTLAVQDGKPHRTQPPVIEVMGLKKTYPGGVEAVKGIDFTVYAGEVFGLLGPNGAGKSTTIGMLTTTVLPTAGAARLAGFDVAKQPLKARQVSSVVFQEAVVDRGLTGLENLELHGKLWGVAGDVMAERIKYIGQQLGVAELLERKVETYSGGQRRRLEIGRALISDPKVLFLDEPTVGLDPRIRHELLDVIEQVRANSEMTILLTTHYLDEAQRLCDRVAIVHLGQIVALDTPERLLAQLGDEILELRVEGDGARALGVLRQHGIVSETAFAVGSTLTIPLVGRGVTAALAEIEQTEVAVASFSTRPPSLDDVYLRLTGETIAAAA